MNLLVLALLVGLWSAILLPGAVRAHRASSSLSTVDAFRRAMDGLAGRRHAEHGEHEEHEEGGGDPVSSQASRRRRRVLAVLCGGLVLGAAGVVNGITASAWLVGVDAIALAAYLALWAGLRSRAEETRRKVRPLPARSPSDSPPPAGADAAALPRAAGEQA